MKLEDYIGADEYGDRFVAGHRVPLQSVLWAHIEQEMDGRQLADRFETLTLEKIYAVLAYYYRNKDEVDQYLRDTEASIEQQRTEFFEKHSGPTIEKLRERMRRKRQDSDELKAAS